MTYPRPTAMTPAHRDAAGRLAVALGDPQLAGIHPPPPDVLVTWEYAATIVVTMAALGWTPPADTRGTVP